MAFLKKEPSQAELLKQTLTSWLIQNAGNEILLADLNECLYQNNFFSLHYFAQVGFQAENKQAVLTARVKKDAVKKLNQLKEADFNAEFTSTKIQKSILDGILTSESSYFRLYVAPSALKCGTDLLKTFAETKIYQADKKTGAFVASSIQELLYLCYRFDLAQNPQLAVKNLSLTKLVPASVTAPILTTLTAIYNNTISEVDLQYLFTWVLQYSATITATSTLFASYSASALPPEVLAKTQAIVRELSKNFAASTTVLTPHATQDALGVTSQLLEQIPALFEEANEKMTTLRQKLQAAAEDENKP